MIISPKTGKPVDIDSPVGDNVSVAFLTQEGYLSADNVVISEQNIRVSESDWKRYGKVETYDGKDTYYLKKWRGGRPGETLVDPYGLLSKAEDMSAFAVQRGQRFCEYARVNKDIFSMYVNYLRSRNPIWFKNCEREILNG